MPNNDFGPEVPRDFANAPTIQPVAWNGDPRDPVGLSSFGIFDDDDAFFDDAPRVANFVASSLGYPIMDVELTDEMIYKQFEKAIMEFSALVNEYNMREQMMSLLGTSREETVTGKLVRNSPLPYVVEMAKMYGTEAGVGGYVSHKKGFIELEAGVQDYDLNELWADIEEDGNRIEIRRIWHERAPAMGRFFDPFAGGAGQGIGIQNLLGQFGWGNYAVASQYLLMPMYETLLRVQAIELNDTIRRSQYTFELRNNQLRITPIPAGHEEGMKLWFQYVVLQDKFDAIVDHDQEIGDVITDYSNATYEVMPYQFINDVGRNWIWKYTLALCKVVLGKIRSKYESLPIPNSEMRLDGLTLRQEGQEEMAQLIEHLRETLVETGKTAQMEKMLANEDAMTEVLKKVPMPFYIG